MIFIYGQNDPWTAAGVTWLKGKEYSCLCATRRKSFGPYRHFTSKKEKEEAIELIKNGWKSDSILTLL